MFSMAGVGADVPSCGQLPWFLAACAAPPAGGPPGAGELVVVQARNLGKSPPEHGASSSSLLDSLDETSTVAGSPASTRSVTPCDSSQASSCPDSAGGAADADAAADGTAASPSSRSPRGRISRSKAAFCGDVYLRSSGGIEAWPRLSKLQDARLVWHPPAGERPARAGLLRSLGAADRFYEEMGLAGPDARHCAVWLHWDRFSVLFASRVHEPERLAQCFTGDFLAQRLRSSFTLPAVRLPSFLSKYQEPQSLSSFFGRQNVGHQRVRTGTGAEIACIHIDLHASWLLQMAVKTVPLRLGMDAELLLVDWPSRSTVAAARFTLTEELLALIRAPRRRARSS